MGLSHKEKKGRRKTMLSCVMMGLGKIKRRKTLITKAEWPFLLQKSAAVVKRIEVRRTCIKAIAMQVSLETGVQRTKRISKPQETARGTMAIFNN